MCKTGALMSIIRRLRSLVTIRLIHPGDVVLLSLSPDSDGSPVTLGHRLGAVRHGGAARDSANVVPLKAPLLRDFVKEIDVQLLSTYYCLQQRS